MVVRSPSHTHSHLPQARGTDSMVPPPRTLLVGPTEHRFRRRLDLLFVVGVFALTFLAYAVGLFDVAGGVVFLAADAAVVGLVGAASFGYRRSGLAFGWLAAYAPLLGYSADHYFLGLSGRPLTERLAAFLSPDGLVFLGVEALVIGTVAWTVGVGAAYALDAFSE